MPETYDVIWTPVAEADLLEVIEYLAADSVTAAKEAVKKIRKRAKTLYIFPERGRIAPELNNIGVSRYRELLIPPWRLIYRIDKHCVYVLAVLNSRRNLEIVLLERLVR